MTEEMCIRDRQNYCATVLNEVVKAVNENRAGISEISRCVDVLEADPDNADAPEILQTCIGRFWNGTAGKQIMLEGVGDFAAYEEAADRLLLMAEQDGAYKAAAESLVVPAGGQAYLSPVSYTHLDVYKRQATYPIV